MFSSLMTMHTVSAVDILGVSGKLSLTCLLLCWGSKPSDCCPLAGHSHG